MGFQCFSQFLEYAYGEIQSTRPPEGIEGVRKQDVQATVLGGIADDDLQRGHLDRLADEVERAQLHRADRVVERRLPGQDDPLAVDPSLPAQLEVFGEVTDDKNRLPEVDAVLVRSKTKCTREYIDQAENLRLIIIL